MYILDKVFLPRPPPSPPSTWRDFFGTLLALVSRRKGIKRRDGAKYFAIREVTSCRFFSRLGRFRRCRILKAYIFRSHYLAYLSRRLPRDPILLRPSPLLQHTRIHLHKGVRETNVTGKNPYVALPPSSSSSSCPPRPSVFDKSDRDSWIFRENPGLSGQDERKITIFDSREGRIKKM